VVHSSTLGVDFVNDLHRFSMELPVSTIFDVGGNIGQTALALTSAFPQARIFSFEPVPSTFAQLKRNVSRHANIEALPFALGASPGTASIGFGGHSGSNSILLANATPHTVEVEVATVDQFASRRDLPLIDLLKIDVEGFELPVLEGAIQWLEQKRIRFVYAECVYAPHPHEPHTSFFDLHACLERHGFVFVCGYTQSFGLKAGCSMGNVLYALREHLPTAVPGKIANVY
jgi:FkbM family methyltransferase